MQDKPNVPHGYCECGCGGKTRVAPWTIRRCGHVKGQPVRFLPGHVHRKRTLYVEEDRGYDTPCWIWQLSISRNGYGDWRLPSSEGGRRHKAHKLFWERVNGFVPHGLDLDHLCRVRSCVNPDHLEPVSRVENVRRGRGVKLTVEAVREIKKLRAEGMSGPKLARRFGVTRQCIYSILNGERWSDVT